MLSRLSDIINGISFLGVYLLAHVDIEYKYLIYTAIISVNALFGVLVFLQRKTEIKNIIGLVRTGFSFKTFAPLIFSFACFISAEYFVDYYFELSESDNLTLLLIPLFGTTILSNAYQSFVFGIRIFKEGIKLPGAQSQLIHWQNITEISRKENITAVSFNGKTKSFSILKQDFNNIDQVISLFKNK